MIRILIIFSILFSGGLYAVDTEIFSTMSSDEKKSFFMQEKGQKLSNADDFIPVLMLGLMDTNIEVKQKAFMFASQTMVGLQKLRAKSIQMPFDLSEMPKLQKVLLQNLSNKDDLIRSGSISALIYSDSPNPTFESSLVKQFKNEENPEIKASILESLVYAGYDSEEFKELLVESLEHDNRHVIEKAALGISVLVPEGALPKLANHLSLENKYYLSSILNAMAAYGENAKSYLPKLYEILDDPLTGGTLPRDIRKSIQGIKDSSSIVRQKKESTFKLYEQNSSVEQKNERFVETETFKEELPPREIEPFESVEPESTEKRLVENGTEKASKWLYAAIALFFIVVLFFAYKKIKK